MKFSDHYKLHINKWIYSPHLCHCDYFISHLPNCLDFSRDTLYNQNAPFCLRHEPECYTSPLGSPRYGDNGVIFKRKQSMNWEKVIPFTVLIVNLTWRWGHCNEMAANTRENVKTFVILVHGYCLDCKHAQHSRFLRILLASRSQIDKQWWRWQQCAP